MTKLTLYAKAVPTDDWILLGFVPNTKKKDVQIYKDKKGTNPFVKIAWWHKSKPTKRNKYITLNCFKYNLTWI